MDNKLRQTVTGLSFARLFLTVRGGHSATSGGIEVFYAYSFADRLPLGVGQETIDKGMIGADPVEPNRLAYGGHFVLGGQQVKVARRIVRKT